MTTGPLEYLVIGFEGNHFTGEIAPELRSLEERGIMRVVDLIFIQKDRDGAVATKELTDLNPDERNVYGDISGHTQQLLSADDIEDVASTMPIDSAAAIAIIEHLWAVKLKEAVLKAHGTVLDDGIIPGEAAEGLGVPFMEDRAAQLH
jgi:uncharacterized membrane protein